MLEEVLLEQDQERLLSALVEKTRNVPSDRRGAFVLFRSREGSWARIPRMPDTKIEAHPMDIEILDREGLVIVSRTSKTTAFFVTPRGFRYYEDMKKRIGEPTQRVEIEIRDYLNGDQFRKRYPEANQKWASAEELLLESDSERQFTMIGHLCREAMQEFVTVLVEQYQPANVEKEKAKTVARIRAVLDSCKEQLGATEKPFLEALLRYWGTVCDLVQRQEHGAQKEGEALVWEDGRRVVFQTAVVMFEIDRALS